MNLHILQHVPFEGPGHIADWARQNGHGITITPLYGHCNFPDQRDFDMLVVLGGPMNIYEHDRFDWLQAEKIFIRQTIDLKKPVLGICLGSQLIADVLGAKVFRNAHPEIGWIPVRKTPEGQNHPLLNGLDFETPVFHWHGDTFDLPQGAVNLFETPGCRNQMFAFADNVLGIQFHPEASPEAISQMVAHGKDELRPSLFVQSETDISERFFTEPNRVLSKLLDRFAALR